jgi:hypothetical protein
MASGPHDRVPRSVQIGRLARDWQASRGAICVATRGISNACKGLVAGLVDLGPTSSAVDVGRCDRVGMMRSTKG